MYKLHATTNQQQIENLQVVQQSASRTASCTTCKHNMLQLHDECQQIELMEWSWRLRYRADVTRRSRCQVRRQCLGSLIMRVVFHGHSPTDRQKSAARSAQLSLTRQTLQPDLRYPTGLIRGLSSHPVGGVLPPETNVLHPAGGPSTRPLRGGVGLPVL